MFNKVSASAISLALTLGVFTFHPSSQKLELSPAHNSPGTLLIDVFAAPAITAVETTDGVNKSSDFTAENANLQKASPQLKTLLNNDEAMSAETTEKKTVENQSTGETPNTESETEIPTVAEEGITTQSTGYELQTAPMELASEFQVVGATWTGATPERIDVRTSINGIWGEWYALEINDSEPEKKNGTEPYIAAGSDGVQLRAIGTTLPTSFDLALLTGTSSNSEVAVEPTLAKELPTPESHSEAALNEAEATTTNGKNISWLDSLQSNDSLHGNSPFPTDGERGKSQSEISGTKWVLPESGIATTEAAFTANTLAQTTSLSNSLAPKIVSRSEWGAGKATWSPKAYPLKGAVIHHTAGNNVYTAAQAPGIVRSIFQYHAITLGWGDIGYNFLVDKYGVIYEGRSGSLTATPGQMVQGAHAANANTYSVGISVLGSYINGVQPSNASITAIENILAWQFDMAGINPFGKWTTTTDITTNVIAGHKDVGSTACPGLIYDRLGDIRANVAKIISEKATSTVNPPILPDPEFVGIAYLAISSKQVGKGWPGTNVWGAGDFTSDGFADLILRNQNGELILYNGKESNLWEAPQKIGRGWGSFADLYMGVDFNGDEFLDIVGRTTTGDLLLYPGNGNGGFEIPQKIGKGWQSFKSITLAQSGMNKKPAFITINSLGEARLYPTNGSGTFLTPRSLGKRPDLTSATYVGDWDLDGYSDIVAIQNNGDLYSFRFTEEGISFGTKIGKGWGSMKKLLLGDFGEAPNTLYAINNSGLLYSYHWK